MVRKLSASALLAATLFFAGAPALATDCCEVHFYPGCDDWGIESCVCAQDSYCCDTEWDDWCVGEVEEFGCGSCSGGFPPGSGDCCEANGTPGCNNNAVQSCVCANDAYCCETQWDSICAGEVEDFGCGTCGGGPDNVCPGYTGGSSCCTTDNPCGWDNDGLCDCNGTCSWDSGDCGGGSECGDGWCDADESCSSCPSDCGSCQGSGACCEANGTPGCDDPAVQACVCAGDAYCCETEWDSICAGEVEDFGCGTCGGGPDDTCPGYTGGSSCCKTSNPCGWEDDGLCDCNGTCAWDDGDCGGGFDCGNGTCDADEFCDSCPEDCGWCGADGDCCEANGSPGCDHPEVASCVCAADVYCCNVEWDDICVDEVESLGCGTCGGTGPSCGDGQCGGGEDCGSCPDDCGPCAGGGSCCEVQDGPGCGNPTIQACVCALDAFCCDFTWDSICVDEVEEFGCGSCTGGGCGDGQCTPDEDCLLCPEDCGPCGGSDCCTPHDTAGCDDPAIQSCVCAEDSYCCETQWDGICADEVTSLGCGQCGGDAPQCGNGACEGGEGCKICPEDCGPCPGGGSCCEPQDTPGCDNPDIQACVCALDAYCCNTEWDDICVDEVEGEGCGSCAPCQPQCAGKECGTDGCGGSCGTCGEGKSCQNGKCVGGACTPQCTGKECGPDGCGGSCGECGMGKTCNNGKCVGGCQPQCAGKQCGPDGCGGNCGTCPPGLFCNDGHCQQSCQPDCAGKKCGSDGCGGTCGTCPPGFFCTADGHCDAQCQPACAGKQCGPDGCGGSCGTCPPNQTCTNGHCTSSCQPGCAGKQCGDDGCGGSCGNCPPSQYCNLQGHCIADCVPDCVGKECGSDGCGGSCGACGFGDECVAGMCAGGCQPSCLGKECGDNGCGGSCGVCGADYLCSPEGLCLDCLPDCTDRECGDDGCGGSCGSCGAKGSCDPDSGTCFGPGSDATWPDDPWGDGYGADGLPWGDQCLPGERLLYGKCVPEEESEGKDVDSSCSASPGGSPSTLLLLLLLLAGVLALPRRAACRP